MKRILFTLTLCSAAMSTPFAHAAWWNTDDKIDSSKNKMQTFSTRSAAECVAIAKRTVAAMNNNLVVADLPSDGKDFYASLNLVAFVAVKGQPAGGSVQPGNVFFKNGTCSLVIYAN